MTLREWTAKITPPDAAAMEEARRRQAQLAKPPGSLGRENFVLQQRRNAVEQEHAVSVGGIQTREDAPRALDRFKVQPRAVGNVAADTLIVLGVGGDHRGNVVMLFPRG